MDNNSKINVLNKMRVLLISHTCQSITEGQARAEYLSRHSDIDLKVLIPDRWRHYGEWRRAQISPEKAYSLEIDKVVWPWVGPAQWYLHWYPGLVKILREFKPDIIDIWEEPWNLESARVCWLRNKILPGAKIVSETEQNINKVLPFPFESFRSYTLRNADFVIGRSSEAIDVIRIKGYPGPAEVVPNGVDTCLFKPMGRDACRGELGISGFTVGYVGRLVEEKGLMDIIDALPLCAVDVNIIFVGSGPFQKAIEARAREIGRTRQVRFVLPKPQDGLPQIMNAIDALILVSRTTKRWKEQFGRVVVEAGACGTPIIGSNSGAIPEVVGQAGLLLPERDPQALASAIDHLSRDPGLRAKLGAAGKRQAEENCSWERVACRMKSIYYKVTNQRSGG